MIWLMVFLMFTSASCARQKPVLRVAGFTAQPYMNLRAIAKGQFPAGIDVDALDIITKKLNYSYILKPTKLPTMVVNGTWFGGIGELVADRADVGIGHISLMYPRFNFVDMAYPMYTSQHVMMVVKAKPLPQHFNLVKAFSPKMWTLTALATVGVCMMQPFLTTMTTNGSKMSFVESLLLVIGIILHQGQSFGSKQKLSTRISITNWLIFAFLIWMAFETDLLSYLISVDYERDINTVDDIITTGRPFFTIYGRPSLNAMGFSPRKINQEVMEKSKKEQHFIYMSSTMIENINTLVEAYGGMNVPFPIYQRYLRGAHDYLGFSPFRKASEILYIQHTGLAFQKNSPLTKEFHDQLKYLVSGGIINQLLVRNMPLAKIDVGEENTDVPLNFQHFSLGLSLLAVGLLSAVAVFVREIRTGKSIRKKSLDNHGVILVKVSKEVLEDEELEVQSVNEFIPPKAGEEEDILADDPKDEGEIRTGKSIRKKSLGNDGAITVKVSKEVLEDEELEVQSVNEFISPKAREEEGTLADDPKDEGKRGHGNAKEDGQSG